MTKLCIKILVKADSAIESAFPKYCNAPRPFMHAFSLQGLDAEGIPIFTGCFQETKKIGLHTESDLLELLA